MHTCIRVTIACAAFGSLLTGLLFFSRFAEISPEREPNAAGPTIMCHEVATLVHPIESSKPAARAKGIHLIVLLEVPRPLEGRPYLASVARQSPLRQENSWRFRVDLADVGKSALSTTRRQRELSCTALSATSHGLGITLWMTLVYPVRLEVATQRTRLTPWACPMLCSVEFLSAIRDFF